MAEAIGIVIFKLFLFIICYIGAACSIESAIDNFKRDKYFMFGIELIASILFIAYLVTILYNNA